MARAAVRAKQAERAKMQAAKPAPRGRKRHASGGNPNQDLFFTRLRRRQRWVFAGLAIVFAISFTVIGVGSGNGSGLDRLFSGILGSSNDAVSKAQAEIKANPKGGQGYKDLANAYAAKSDLTNAISTLTSYTGINKKDTAAWQQLGKYEKDQADIYAQQYRDVVTASELQAPGVIFQPTGALATQLGTNPIDQYYTKQESDQSAPLYKNAIDGYTASVSDFKNAAKYSSRGTRASAELLVFAAAQLSGDTKSQLDALQQYIALSPRATNIGQIVSKCKQLAKQSGGSAKACVPAHKKK